MGESVRYGRDREMRRDRETHVDRVKVVEMTKRLVWAQTVGTSTRKVDLLAIFSL